MRLRSVAPPDPRTSEELLAAHRLERADERGAWSALLLLWERGGTTEFEMGRDLVQSPDPEERSIGADLLGQLGTAAPTFVEESVDILLDMLDDPDPDVVWSAVINLGHRSSERAAPAVAAFAGDPDPDMRHAVAVALGGLESDVALETLIRLSRDEDRDTRNWAVFGLGSQSDSRAQEVVDVLLATLDEGDDEIRGEALVGLARRHHPAARDALLKEWADGSFGSLSLEAAEELGDPALAPRLLELLDEVAPDDEEWMRRYLLDALAACSPGAGPT